MFLGCELFRNVQRRPARACFVDSLKSCIQDAKRSEMFNYVMKDHLFAVTQESCLEFGNVHIGCSTLLFVDLLILRNRIFRLGNVQICVVLSWMLVILLIFTNSVFKLQNLQIWSVSKCKSVYF